ncbi:MULTISPECIES: tyrosine-protein phosphatase [unclassified Flavobacterium]|uniref:tyrosine-protein phosphatase n=1 Tax=unclassified Flavobacterium TaxID=196869 RepID=UPI001F14150C|nr:MULTISPECIES: CpsB/CapC family capsule biosynthesis tyrosine phosphatase [unclassified Flavobacterium]UMY65817.1 histidinol phosphatase [Flavobacterium sp. HJ-32-4]
MLFFKKKRFPLRTFLENGYVDIHSHLVFGIDDGASSFDDSLTLVRQMQELGVQRFITTPHTIAYVWDNTKEIIETRGAETASRLREAGIESPFSVASEYMMDETLLRRMQQEPLLTLKDLYVLVEMSYISPPMQLFDIIFELRLAGYKPVLAHPERYLFYHGQMPAYEKLKRAGCLFQLNLLSVTGYYGGGVVRMAKELIKAGMIDLTGSDVHHQRHLDAFASECVLTQEEAVLFRNAITANEMFR